jgi:hypothetical protein
MALRYWRTLLVASLLGLGGLAVWASDVIRPTPPADVNRAEPSAPPMAVPSAAAHDPQADLPLNLPVAPPVLPPSVIPTRAERVKEGEAPPPIPKAALELPPPPPSVAPLPPTAVPAAAPAPSPPSLAVPQVAPMATAPPEAPIGPVGSRQPIKSLAATRSAPTALKLHVRMGGNLGPRFEVRDGENLLLKVYCDHLDLHGKQEGETILPGLTATGHVRFSGSGLNGTCETLQIDAVDGQVRLKGQVKLTCYRGNASSQVFADTLTFQLKGSLEVPTRASSSDR